MKATSSIFHCVLLLNKSWSHVNLLVRSFDDAIAKKAYFAETIFVNNNHGFHKRESLLCIFNLYLLLKFNIYTISGLTHSFIE